jgi:nucleotide-binding universal stress UspA family protein
MGVMPWWTGIIDIWNTHQPPTAMKKILVPTDFSACAQSSCRLAAVIAEKTGAEILLLHAAYAAIDWPSLPIKEREHYPETMARIEDAQIRLEALRNDPIFKKLKVREFFRYGSAFAQILELATREKVDLIVIGTHGAGEQHTPFVGSHAQKVVRMAPCPVLSVKKGFNGKVFRKLLFASDFDVRTAQPFSRLLRVANHMGMEIELLYVNTPLNFRNTDAIDAQIQKFLAEFPDEHFKTTVYNDLTPEDGIMNYAAGADIDGFAMLTHGLKEKPDYLIGVTETLTVHTDLPVLSFSIK